MTSRATLVYLAVDVVPLPSHLLETARFVESKALAMDLETRNELDDVACGSFDGQAQPSLLRVERDLRWACCRMPRVQEMRFVMQNIGGVARTHEPGRSLRLAWIKEYGFAARGEDKTAFARAK